MIKACVDLGSNTFLLLITEIQKEKIIKILVDESRFVRLAEGVSNTGLLGGNALDRAEKCLKEFSELIKRYKATEVVGVATSAARDAKNNEELLELGHKYNIPISVISGHKEAELTFKGATYELTLEDQKETAVIDVGGSSTEIVALDEQKKVKGYSLDIGSVRLFEKFNKKDIWQIEELKQLDESILKQIQSKSESLPECKKNYVAVAGTPTTMAAVDQQMNYDPKLIHNYLLSLETLSAWRDKLANMTSEERSQIKGMVSDRADIIVYGLSILVGIVKYFRADQVRTSIRGVRYGLTLNS